MSDTGNQGSTGRSTNPIEEEPPPPAPITVAFYMTSGAAIGFAASRVILENHPKLWIIILILLILLAIIFGVINFRNKSKNDESSGYPNKGPKEDSTDKRDT